MRLSTLRGLALLLLAQVPVALPAQTRATIYRDTWGVPHIYADREEDGWYALGIRDRDFGGNDKMKAADGTKDKVDCGGGNKDKATVDPIDKVKNNCEKVKEK